MNDSTSGSAPDWVPPPPPPPPSSTPPLTRSAGNRVIAGVCGGLGAHFRVDPVIVRIAFVALSFAGGLGIVLYVAGWVLIPESGGAKQVWSPGLTLQRHGGRTVAAGVLLAAGLLALASGLGVAHQGMFWGLGLVGVGVLLLLQEQRRQVPDGTAPAPPTPYAAASFHPAWVPAAPVWSAPPTLQPRSVLGVITLAAALLAVGVAALLDSIGWVSVSLAMGAAIALIIVGAGLVAGTWFGRSRVLIAVGILLIPFTAAATLIHEPFTGGTGNVVVTPQTLAEVQTQYHLAAGQLTIDLREIPIGTGSTIAATVALGKLTVVVPPGANVSVSAHTGAGHINLFGAYDDGVNIDSSAKTAAAGAAGSTHLALSVGFGEVEVVNGDASNPVPARVP